MKKIILTNDAPSPIGPYSQAVLSNGFLFCSGQIAINPDNGELVVGQISEETHQVMKNIASLLRASDMDFHHIVKTTIFLSDMKLFAEVNEVYASYFKEQFPARETVAVLGLPKGVNVEISVTASLS